MLLDQVVDPGAVLGRWFIYSGLYPAGGSSLLWYKNHGAVSKEVAK
jgi:hypothetical protein